MTSTPYTDSRQNRFLHYIIVGVLAPVFLSFVIPYLRTRTGTNGMAYFLGQYDSWQIILADSLFLFLFTGVLFSLGAFVLKKLREESILISLLLGLLITGASYILFLQNEVLQVQAIYEGNGVIYAISFLMYAWLLIYRTVRLSEWQLGNHTRGIAIVGLLVAMNITLGRIGITTPVVRITFAFLPTALIGLLFGPWVAGVAAVLADLLGFIVGGGVGGFFPGFTLSAFLTGLIYGVFLHKRKVSTKRVIMAEVVIAVFVNLTLNTLWLRILTQNPIAVLLPPRLIQNAVMIVVRVFTVRFIANNKQLRRVYMKYSTARH
ncbi:folate family ECF transporter S component [Alkalibacterium sp.]